MSLADITEVGKQWFNSYCWQRWKKLLVILLNPQGVQLLVLEQDQVWGIVKQVQEQWPSDKGSEAWQNSDFLAGFLLDLLAFEELPEGCPVLLAVDMAMEAKYINLPKMDAAGLKDALKWEVPQHFLWEPGSYAYAYTVEEELDLPGKQGMPVFQEQKVLLAAMEQVYIDSLLRTCQQNHWRLEVLTGAGLLEEQDGWQELEFWDDFYTKEKLAELRQQYYDLLQIICAWIKGHLPLNLLPKAEIDQRRKQSLQHWSKLTGIAMLGLSVALNMAAYGKLTIAKQESRQLEQRLEGLKPWQQRRQELRALERELKQLEQAFAGVQQQPTAGQLWEAWGRCVPLGVWLNKIEQQKQGYSIQGKATDMEKLIELQQRLKSYGYFAQVELVETKQLEQMGGLQFLLKLTSREASGKGQGSPLQQGGEA